MAMPGTTPAADTIKGAPRLEVATLGFSDLGGERQLKHLLEDFWGGRSNEEELLRGARRVEEEGWALQAAAGIDVIGVGDFALYDWVLNWIECLGCVPPRFLQHANANNLTVLERHFLMARGGDGGRSGGEGHHPATEDSPVVALGMRKWFDTNTLYLMPEFDERITPHANFQPLLDSFARAKAMLGVERAVPMLLGPITFVWLGHLRPEDQQQQTRFEAMLASLIPLYQSLLDQIAEMGFSEVQFHEPALITEHGHTFLLPHFEPTYRTLLQHAAGTGKGAKKQEQASTRSGLGIDLVTYFDEMHEAVYRAAIALPLAALSLDFTHHGGGSGGYTTLLENFGFPADMRLGLGALDGRSIWKPDPPMVLPDMAMLNRAVKHVRLQASCSLCYLPWSVKSETNLREAHPLVFPLLSFAVEKLADLKSLAEAAMGEDVKVLEEWKWTRLQRDTSYDPPTSHSSRGAITARERSRSLQTTDFKRSLAYKDRQQQQYCFKLGSVFPTTVVGCLPGLGKVGKVTDPGEAGKRAKAEIERVVRLQEVAGVDLLAHGAFDRGDMVEIMAAQLEGMTTTEHGWVRVYGSRCVRPPIVIGDIWRPEALTVEGYKYAQSLTSKVVKGQLPGPTTLLQWSYPAVDRPRKEQILQVALCMRDEVRDLEIAGAKVIEVDELGFREGLPLRGQKRVDYLAFIAEAFRLATSIAGPHIEIHTHVAYTEVEDCIAALLDFDADVYLFENTRAHDTTRLALKNADFPRRLGLGCFDVHCPVVPSVHDIQQRLRAQIESFPAEQVIVVPDGPLRTRSWEEVGEALKNMCTAAKGLREEWQESHRLKVPSLEQSLKSASFEVKTRSASFDSRSEKAGGGGEGGGGGGSVSTTPRA